MNWREVIPEQNDWIKQIDVTAYYGDMTIGSICLIEEWEEWISLIDGSIDYLEAETEEQAKEEMLEKLENHFISEINYFEELIEKLDRLRNREVK